VFLFLAGNYLTFPKLKMVNHQAFTIERLNAKLDELFEKAFTMPVTSNISTEDKDN
jgi:hypothetical protein